MVLTPAEEDALYLDPPGTLVLRGGGWTIEPFSDRDLNGFAVTPPVVPQEVSDALD